MVASLGSSRSAYKRAAAGGTTDTRRGAARGRARARRRRARRGAPKSPGHEPEWVPERNRAQLAGASQDPLVDMPGSQMRVFSAAFCIATV